MAAPGSYANPSHKYCWETCKACFRCANKGCKASCNSCSGRHDPFGHVDADIDDYCDCKNGVLRWRTQKGQLVVSRYKKDPFQGKVTMEKETQDQRDWDQYLRDMREKLDNPTWDPVSIEDENPFSKHFKVLDTE
jgi:hypothetical protein